MTTANTNAAKNPVVQPEGPTAYLGPELSYTHQAAKAAFGQDNRFLPEPTVVDIFAAVAEGRAAIGVAPVENSTEGAVNITLDELVASELTIKGEITLNISHCLLSSWDEIRRVRQVTSHPQALAQCRKWLRDNVPQAEIKPAASTSAAARAAAGDPSLAVVGSAALGAAYGLKILAKGIEDVKPNWTRFLVVGRETVPPTGDDKTTLVFSAKHIPGSLHHSLAPLAKAGLNLTRIESRPHRGRPWEYLFFVDFDGHAAVEPMAGALKELESEVEWLRVLGSYPRGDKPSGEAS